MNGWSLLARHTRASRASDVQQIWRLFFQQLPPTQATPDGIFVWGRIRVGETGRFLTQKPCSIAISQQRSRYTFGNSTLFLHEW